MPSLPLSSRTQASLSRRLTHPVWIEAQARLEERLCDIKLPLSERCALTADSTLPYAATFDLVTACLTFTARDTLLASLPTICASLKPKGLFLGVTLGHGAFHELRVSLSEAEIALYGGVSPRFAPLPAADEIARQLVLAGFALPVVDVEQIELRYPDLTAMMHELRACGCTNRLADRPRHFTQRGLFSMAETIYRERFAAPNGQLKLSLPLIFMHGWQKD